MELVNIRWDRIIAFQTIALGLIGVGLITLASAQVPWTLSPLSIRQLFSLALGLLLMFSLARVDYRFVARYAWWLYGFSILLLLLLLIIAPIIGGSQRWFDLGPIHVQPSEFSKLTLIFALAVTAARLRDQVRWLWTSVFCFLIIIPMFALIFAQPDLGTALVYIAIWFGMLFMGGIPFRIIGSYLLLIILAGASVLPFLKDYQMRRITAFLNPENDPLGAGYQVMQSKIAIGHAGWFGQGLFQGSQNRLGFIPSEESDFIFAIATEETGVAGAIILLLGLITLILAILAVSQITDDLLGKLIAGGIVTMIAFQTFVNVGITLGLLPVTGMPLPFYSYGGSALLTNCAAMGILMSIYRNSAIKGQMKLIRGI